MANPWAWRFLVPAGLAVLVILAFMPSLLADFVDWDDADLMQFYGRSVGPSGEAVSWMFTTTFSGHYHPLTWLSYHLDHQYWGRNAIGLHLTNVVLHALAGVVFYFVARRLLVAADRSGAERGTALRSKPVVLSAALAAVLFAVHPLRAESVAWIAERAGRVERFSRAGVIVVLLAIRHG